MKLWVVKVFTVLCILSSILSNHTYALEQQPSCTLCILEIGTSSILGEEYDFVVIGNSTNLSISLSSVQLQYFNSLGVFDSKISLSGTLASGQVKAFTSDSLKVFNPSSTALPFSIYSGGGSLQLVKILTASTTVYDIVGWGSASLYENEAIETGQSSNHFIRKTFGDNTIIDANDNFNDFRQSNINCSGLKLSEIQPFATDQDGASVESWVELLHYQQTIDDCCIASSIGNYYQLNNSFYGALGDIFSVSAIQINDETIYLQLPNPSGYVGVAYLSFFGGENQLILPESILEYSDLEKGQTVALIEEYGSDVWKITYSTTRDEPNIYSPNPPVLEVGDENACTDVYINEIAPNPEGNDSGTEWVEIINSSDSTKNLEQCVITVEATKYYFLSTSQIGLGEIQRFYELFDESGDPKSLSLRNTDPTLVSMSRLYQQELELLQSFIYENAPEGMSYARFAEGWAWTYSLTPALSNVYLASKPSPVVTEAKASFATAYVASSKPTTAKKTTSTSNKSTATKSLATKAKTTTGAKNTSDRDIYEEPENMNNGNSTDYIFVVLGVLAIMYAIYEYRADIQNYFIKRKRNQKSRA